MSIIFGKLCHLWDPHWDDRLSSLQNCLRKFLRDNSQSSLYCWVSSLPIWLQVCVGICIFQYVPLAAVPNKAYALECSHTQKHFVLIAWTVLHKNINVNYYYYYNYLRAVGSLPVIFLVTQFRFYSQNIWRTAKIWCIVKNLNTYQYVKFEHKQLVSLFFLIPGKNICGLDCQSGKNKTFEDVAWPCGKLIFYFTIFWHFTDYKF